MKIKHAFVYLLFVFELLKKNRSLHKVVEMYYCLVTVFACLQLILLML